jgi:CMP-N-acetylneuraminic acid synthetase
VFLATVPYIQEHGTAVVPGLTRSVVVPRERAVDIDTEDDLVVAEAYLKKQMR